MGLIRKYRVILSEKAEKDLASIDKRLKRVASDTVAKHVREGLLRSAMSLNKLPRRHYREKDLEGEKEEIRSFPKWSYKIIYAVMQDEVVILRFFHTSMDTSRIMDPEVE